MTTRSGVLEPLRYHKYLLLSLCHLLVWCVASISDPKHCNAVIARIQAASRLSIRHKHVKMEPFAHDDEEGTLSHTSPTNPTVWWPP